MKIHKNERKGLYSTSKFVLWKLNLKYKNKQTDASCTNLVVLYIYYFNTTWVICNFFKDKQSSCQVLNMAAVLCK